MALRFIELYTPQSRSYLQTFISSPSELTTTDEPINEAGQQSAHSSSDLLQDLIKELQNRSPFPLAWGGYEDIYLVKPDGTVPVRPACTFRHVFS
jgi:hypothetical protein